MFDRLTIDRVFLKTKTLFLLLIFKVLKMKFAKFCMSAVVFATLTACGGGDSDSSTNVSSTGINALLGSVSFAYNFYGSSTVFNDAVTFTSSDFDNNNLVKSGVSGIPGRVIACTYNGTDSPFEQYPYLCVISSDIDVRDVDIFWFNVNNGYISGRYNYCVEPLSSDACISDVAFGADGSVTGSVTSSQSRQAALSYEAGMISNDEKVSNKSQRSSGEISLTDQQKQLASEIGKKFQKLAP
ncbi:MAG: hypothetical protein RLZZ352_788 [Pseudomonadota bacterium]|jgi:hypothetical protein